MPADLWYAGVVVDTNTKSIIATVIGTGLSLAMVILTAIGGINDRIDDLNNRIDDLNRRIDDVQMELRDFRREVHDRFTDLEARVRNVEIAFAKVDQRLLIIERIVLPTPPDPPSE